MRMLHQILLGCLLAAFVGCAGETSKDKIVGTWKNQEDKGRTTLEFKKDGTFSFDGVSHTKGTYKLVEDHVEFQADPPGGKWQLKISLANDEMTTTDEKGEKERWKRSP